MHATTLFLASLGTASTAFAAPNEYSTSSSTNGICTDYSVTADFTSTNLKWVYPQFESNLDIAAFIANATAKDSATTYRPLVGNETVTKKHTIAATFCTPKIKVNGKEKTVLLASHGAAYDGRYWASTYKPKEYSFVEYALANGYSVFYYDRLGTGRSSRDSGYTTQVADQVSILTHLASSIRAGHYTSSIRASKLVLVGHSFGSFISNLVAGSSPNLIDAVVLTGIAYPNATIDQAAALSSRYISAFWAVRIASSIQNGTKYSAKLYDTGYLFFADMYAHISTFLHNYEKDVAEYANSITQPFSVAEIEALGLVDLPAPGFKGKVLIASGQYDLLCGGDCYSTFKDGLQKLIWSGATKLEMYVHPGSGHGVNFNRNATGMYEVVVNFLDDNL